MVAYSGASVCADRLRPLNQPRRIRVEVDARGYPIAVAGSARIRRHSGSRVAEVLDRWRIDDEWWRAPSHAGEGGDSCRGAGVSRMYFQVVLENQQLLTIFHDLVAGSWYAQTTATPLTHADPVYILAPTAPAPSRPGRDENATIPTRGQPVRIGRIGAA